MSNATVLVSRAGGVVRLTLNRPDKLNSFTRAMHAELREALAAAGSDAECRVVVLTGAGRAFSAGQDLADTGCRERRCLHGRRQDAGGGLQPADQDDHHAGEAGHRRGQRRRRRVPPPTSRFACDLVYAARSATLPAGLRADRPGPRCRRHLGAAAPRRRGAGARPRHAGRTATRREGGGLGPDLEVRGRRQAGSGGRGRRGQARRRPQPTGWRLPSRRLRCRRPIRSPQQLDLERDLQRLAGASPDAREGILAFLEKRAPKYTGRKA